MGYTVVRPENNHDEAALWQAARATTAAPIFFKPITVAGQEYWDGGLGFPNPIELAMWECSRIWDKNISRDVIISLGTGEASKGLTRRKTHSLQKLWTSFMDFLDGHTRYGDVRNGLDEQRRQDFFRLNTELPFPIRLDDVQSIPLQKEQIHLHPPGQLIEVATALLVSNFYFQLDTSPIYDGGFYLCEGSIRCRGVYKNIVNALITLYQPEIEFVTANETLASLDLQAYEMCSLYNRHVSFYVRHPTENVTISLRLAKGIERKISGFPKNMQWFEVQQGLDSPFTGSGSSQKIRGCSTYSRLHKRKCRDSIASVYTKRVRR
ncbi:hypothetical protein N7499_011039 [Penicillium canescens]|nr:hypothetical protein N7499_011039 [Penicillium canescens]